MSQLSYEATRITYQSDEQMARAFFALAGELAARNAELEAQLAAAAGEQPFPLAWSHAQRIAEAEQFLKAYSDTNMEKLLGDYLVQPIIRKLAAMIGQWQQAAAYAMSADNCAAQPTPAQGDAVPVAVNDYSDMSREALERHATRMAQALANDKARKFHDKYATGPMMPPSCLCCGQLPDKVAIRHAELPGIVICEKCAARQSSADAVDAECWRFVLRASDDDESPEAKMLAAVSDQFRDDGEKESVMMGKAVRAAIAAIAAQGGKGGA